MRKSYPTPYRYILKFPDKYVGDPDNIWIRSSWERRFMVWAEHNQSVIRWSSEPMPIPYFSKVHGKMKRYFIDFFILVETASGLKKIAIEIKPKVQTQMPVRKRGKRESSYIAECLTYQQNSDKWAAAREWCNKNNFEFCILTEVELGIA